MSDSATQPDADEEWENLLRDWRAQPEAQPRPYFYGRVRARLLATAAPKRLPVQLWLRWPAYAVMAGMLLLLSGDDASLHAVDKSPPDSVSQSEAGHGGE